jgi:protocatechuate 3,4-dioxygenase beta subunit
MRPLHSLFVLLALLVLGAGAWFLVRTTAPERRITAAGPAPAAPATNLAADSPAELRNPGADRESGRVQTSLEPAAPAASAQSAATREGSGGRIAGRVLDDRGEPVADARVLAGAGAEPSFFVHRPIDSLGGDAWFRLRESKSDEQGRFTIDGLGAGALKLGVRHPGFAPYDADNVPRPAAQDGELEPIQLERGVLLAGRVVDDAGRPVAGARVLRLPGTASDPLRNAAGALAATTAGDGSFLVDTLAVGAWALRIESEGHPYAGLTGRTTVAGERVEGLLVQLEPSADIRGRVTGQPPAGRTMDQLRVRARSVDAAQGGAATPEAWTEPRQAEVGADGSFELRGLRANREYSLRVVEDSSAPHAFEWDFAASLSAPVKAKAGDRGVVLVLAPEAALSFQVVDAASSAPIETYTVEAGIEWPVQQLGEDGRPLRERPGGLARVGNLRPRTSGERAQLRIAAVGYLPYEADDLPLTPGVDTQLGVIALEPAPVLSVRVLDAKTLAPIPDATVVLQQVSPEDPADRRSMRFSMDLEVDDSGEGGVIFGDGEARQARTDEAGVARLTAFVGGAARLRVRASQHASWSSEVFTGSSTAEEKVVHLGRGGTVIAHLLDAGGEPLGGGRIEHLAPSVDAKFMQFAAREASQMTDAAGEARFEHLEVGLHRFRFAQEGNSGVISSDDAAFAIMMSPDRDDDAGWVDVAVSEGSEQDIEIHAPLLLAVFGELTEAGVPLVDAALSLIPVRAGGAAPPDFPMLEGGAGRTRSGEGGRYRFEDIEAGEYTLRITHPTRSMPAEVALRVTDSDLRQDVDLPVAILEGRVTGSSGEPLAGVEVWAERARDGGAGQAVSVRVMAFASGSGGSSVVSLDQGGLAPVRARTDAEGRYSLRGVLADVDLEVRGKGKNLQPGRSQRVRVGGDERRTGIDVQMANAGSIEVQGVHADGSPARNLLVTARYEGNSSVPVEPVTVLLDEQGLATLEGLAPGNWRLAAREMLPNGAGEPIPDTVVEVRAGAATPTTLSAP